MPTSTARVAIAKSLATASSIAARSPAGTEAGTPPEPRPVDPSAAAWAAEAGRPRAVNELVNRCVSTVVRAVPSTAMPSAEA